MGCCVKKIDIVRRILGERWGSVPQSLDGKAFAPTNIALCKYWGKRNQELNLPVTSSLSISLGKKGASVALKPIADTQDAVVLNGNAMNQESAFYKRLVHFLDLFRHANTTRLAVDIQSNIPVAAGLASSACGFASLVLALNELFAWRLTTADLSILARLGSGSASRSIWQGFVEWQAGERRDGMDSHGVLLDEIWPDLCIGLLIVSDNEKSISSREAMQRTVATSALYSAWPQKVADDLITLKQAIAHHDFELLGQAAESNAMTMHATMLSAWPAVSYAIPETVLAMQNVWRLRQQGLPLYFTQDAGPNIKLLFEKKNTDFVKSHFPHVEIIELLFTEPRASASVTGLDVS